jgi:hypothetical protein
MTAQCASLQDLEHHDGTDAAVIGTYEQLDLRQRPRGAPVHDGHAGIRLDDGTLVLLGPAWSPDAKRPRAELDGLTGREVTVRGTVHTRCSDPPEPIATIIGPCIDPILDVSLRR